MQVRDRVRTDPGPHVLEHGDQGEGSHAYHWEGVALGDRDMVGVLDGVEDTVPVMDGDTVDVSLGDGDREMVGVRVGI